MNDCYFEKKDWRACKEEVQYKRQESFRVTIENAADEVNLLDGTISTVLEDARERSTN
jgi:hypothetical protein